MPGSPGIGDDVGTSPYPTITEREMTAFVAVNKSILAIVPDSIELVFTKFGGNVWKYQSAASRPTMAPLMTVRDTSASKGDYAGIWTEFLEALKNLMASDLQAKLEADALKPREDRDPSLVALGEVLKGAATFLAFLDLAAVPSSAAETRNERNVAIPSWAFAGLQTEGKAFLDAARSFLNTAGANSSDYDALNNVLNDLSGIIDGMDVVP